MFVRRFSWCRLILGLMFGLGLLALGDNAVAQHVHNYWGDDACAMCHSEKYASYVKHGHPWQLVQTAGATPPADLYPPSPEFPQGVPLPQLPSGVTWDQVEYIIGNYKEGTGNLVYTNGYRDLAGKSTYSCGKCHTTGYNPDPTKHQLGLAGLVGTWDLDGIQCEACHGPKQTMSVQQAQDCHRCHTAGDSKNRLQFATAPPFVFTGHHPQGDEVSHSPHKEQGCPSCHDPHKSVWHEGGGILYSGLVGEGNMCTNCHNKRVFGSMKDARLQCVECHMPEVSSGGTRASHIFRINATKPSASDNTFPADGKTWWNTDANDDAFLTLDLVCGQCHEGMGSQEMVRAAASIHRPPGMVDVAANGGDGIQNVGKNNVVSIDFSVYADTKAGIKADWYVLCQGPRGSWSYWNGSRWLPGKSAWRKNVSLVDVANKNVLKSKLSPGLYTYLVCIYPKDGSQNIDSVSVYVNP